MKIYWKERYAVVLILKIVSQGHTVSAVCVESELTSARQGSACNHPPLLRLCKTVSEKARLPNSPPRRLKTNTLNRTSRPHDQVLMHSLFKDVAVKSTPWEVFHGKKRSQVFQRTRCSFVDNQYPVVAGYSSTSVDWEAHVLHRPTSAYFDSKFTCGFTYSYELIVSNKHGYFVMSE